MSRTLPMLVAAFICAIALAFGLVRIGVSGLLLMQAMGGFDVAAFREPVAEIQQFLTAQNENALIPLTTYGYLAIIALMGVCLVFGAVYSWRRNRLGYGLLSIYLLAHAGLFVNFQTINPKINILIGGIILLIILIFTNQRRRV